MKRLIAAMMIALALAAHAAAEDIPWEAPGWSRRVIVVVPGENSGGDVAAVHIYHAGLASPRAIDFRVFDGHAHPVPYQIVAHDPQRDTLISFRCDHPGSTFTIYFDNPNATVDPRRSTADPKPGSGPPVPGLDAQGWIPRAGLVLQTLRRPHDPPNPLTVAQMADLIAHSPGPDGAGYRINISDGFNPFGWSDYYISVYRGWLRIPADGTWGFCTASNEASFSFIDGKKLVDWPGQHTENKGRHGEQHAELQLTKGLHYVEYYHEQTEGNQMAFLGWKPPGTDHYVKIPDRGAGAMFVEPMWARVDRYEQAEHAAAPTIAPELLDSVWPRGADHGQYTRYRLDSLLPPDEAARWHLAWDFGDGQTSAAASPEHVFLHNGTFAVHLVATGPAGQKIELSWPLAVFPIEYMAEGFKYGRAPDLAKIVAAYDRAKLFSADLADLARLAENAADHSLAALAANDAVARPDLEPADLLEMQTFVTGGFLPAGPQAADFARQIHAALLKATDAALKIRILARLIPIAGILQNQPDDAQKLYAQAESLAKEAGVRGPVREAFRLATIASGDVKLLTHRPDAAVEDYHVAEALAATPLPPEVRSAKSGSYPETIAQHLAAREPAAALELVERWMDESPSDKISGAPLFYAGKALLALKRPAPAIRPLRAAIDLAPGSEFEAEARWLLADAQRQTGDTAAATATLQSLIRSGLAGPWLDNAQAELKSQK